MSGRAAMGSLFAENFYGAKGSVELSEMAMEREKGCSSITIYVVYLYFTVHICIIIYII